MQFWTIHVTPEIQFCYNGTTVESLVNFSVVDLVITYMKKAKSAEREFDFDVCLSFAGEDRAYVQKVAEELKDKGVQVFYDEYKQVELWGKDLYEHLDDVYRNSARYCVLFISKAYANKLWSNHERKSAQARAFAENKEYILPARFDKTDIPGLRPTVGYIDLKKITPVAFAKLVVDKIGPRRIKNYLPPKLDRLMKRMGVKKKSDKDLLESQARSFYYALRRMSSDERTVLLTSFRYGCPAELPANTHIAIDLLRRLTSFPTNKILRLLGGLRSLGFSVSIKKNHIKSDPHFGPSPHIVLKYDTLTEDGDATELAYEMVHSAFDSHCEECGSIALDNLDFSHLSTSTYEAGKHLSNQ